MPDGTAIFTYERTRDLRITARWVAAVA